VLPSGFHRIRHYGLLAGGAKADNLARARKLLDVAAPAPEPAAAAANPATPDKPCPCCGSVMRIIEVFKAIAYNSCLMGKFHNGESGAR
jgi:hypothetical protein